VFKCEHFGLIFYYIYIFDFYILESVTLTRNIWAPWRWSE